MQFILYINKINSMALQDVVSNSAKEIKDALKNSTDSTNTEYISSAQYNSKPINDIYGADMDIVVNTQSGSKAKVDRLNILPSNVAFEFNTYKNWAPFSILTQPINMEIEQEGETYEDEKGVITYSKIVTMDDTGSAGPIGRRSLFNLYTAVTDTNELLMSNNSPLLDIRTDEDYVNNRRLFARTCDIKSLVAASASGMLGVETYNWSDFMYCKYLGKVSNEYMITLRRFPYPPGDHINVINEYESGSENTKHPGDIGRMITWLGTPGNEMSNILKYTVNIPYKRFDAKIEEIDEDKQHDGEGILGSLMSLGEKRNADIYKQGLGGDQQLNLLRNTLGLIPKVGNAASSLIADSPTSYKQWQTNYDANKSYGPLDVITTAYQRRGAQDGGLEFEQNIQLQFEYEMRSYDGVNAKAAMLDLIANVLATCYTTGKFWGGAYRFLGASASNVFANNPAFMERNGNMAEHTKRIADMMTGSSYTNENADASKRMSDYMDRSHGDSGIASSNSSGNTPNNIINGVTQVVSNLFSNFSNLIQNAGSSLGALLYGGLVNKLGRPAVLCVNSLLSDAPTGLWHLTIGNPKAPIMTMGNMYIKECSIEHTGPLGLDGFPTGLKVNVTLSHAKPRDNTAIERMYMQGDYRIYSPMGTKIEKMYKGAPLLSSLSKFRNTAVKKNLSKEQIKNQKRRFYIPDNIPEDKVSSLTDDGILTYGLQRYFGTSNSTNYLNIISREALFGSTRTDEANEHDNVTDVMKSTEQKIKDLERDIKDAESKQKEINDKMGVTFSGADIYDGDGSTKTTIKMNQDGSITLLDTLNKDESIDIIFDENDGLMYKKGNEWATITDKELEDKLKQIARDGWAVSEDGANKRWNNGLKKVTMQNIDEYVKSRKDYFEQKALIQTYKEQLGVLKSK